MINHRLISTFIVISISLLSTNIVANDGVKRSDYSLTLSVTTSAPTSAIWSLWEDVANWKDFDERLEYSYLLHDAAFEKNTEGYVKATGAPKTKFTLTDVDRGISFTEVLHLPLWQKIYLYRHVEQNTQGQTVFTHKVTFSGALKSLYYCLLAQSFENDLASVMQKMKMLAEQRIEK